ncbi:MAG: amidohydrolase family protein [Proteobacteria bacterium]|nr:amidohydrolase family protein [Pseudomonadota bacterium]
MALAIEGVALWDGGSDRLHSGPLTVRVEHGRVTGVGDDPELRAGARIEAHPGATLMPGLVDGHVHMTLDPELRDPAANAALAPDRITADMERRADAMLRAGITTARDLGGGLGLELDLRDRIAAGVVSGPRLVCAGQPVTTPGGHCHFWGGEARDEAERRAVVARQSATGADWIKVMASGGVITRGSRPWEPQFSQVELGQIVDEAGRRGLPVAAHCHGTRSIASAVAAGVRTVEHCSFAGRAGFGSDFDAGVVESVARSSAWVSPTVNAGWARRLEAEGDPSGFALRMGALLRALVKAGARFLASTDAGIPRVHHDRLADGLAIFARLSGLSNAAVLRSATSEAARALGLDTEIGQVRIGAVADLMAVPGDPLQDLTCLRRPLQVWARGRPVLETG